MPDYKCPACHGTKVVSVYVGNSGGSVDCDRCGGAGRVPNPGSDMAIAQGCRCPVMDNCHGKWAPRPPDGWWIVLGCPIHG